MIPVIDQVMDCRDVCANVMLLTDDDKANDTMGWIALTLTGIGFIPVLGSAVKGVGKVIVKNANGAITLAAATLRKLGKGDPIAYIKNIDWQGLAKEGSALITEKITALRDALNSITDTWVLKATLSDEAIASLTKHSKQLNEVLPKIEDGIAKAAKVLEAKTNKALDEYTGELAHAGKTGNVKKVKTLEKKTERGNELNGAPPIKRVRNPILDKHYKNLAEYEAAYEKKLAKAIENGDSNRRIGAFKARLTEVKGERTASAYMEKHFSKPPPPAQMELGFGPGPGVDQVWAKRDKDGKVLEYFIVEAKGPGAKLGKTSKGFTQMDDDWIEMNLNRMKNSKKYPDRNQLGQDLLKAIKREQPKTNKLIIEAIEDNGSVIGGKLQELPTG
ncbi:hypothetical protein EMK97_03820 [Litorilituus sediminis]|uniref:Uncharacterized protein n=2 Tax=Litorilituus sediminis TaxID=718192 RepID=A0A4P6PDA4_9GAMM|nr:hypothetical protein EMK97_03820 [Litorilituus sediminis]